MGKTRKEKMQDILLDIEQRKNRYRLMEQAERAQERKDRTKRLCKRMGLMESRLPGLITLTDGQFQTFFEKTMLTDYGRKMLTAAAVLEPTEPGHNGAETAAQGGNAPASQPAGTAQGGGAAQPQGSGSGAKAAG